MGTLDSKGLKVYFSKPSNFLSHFQIILSLVVMVQDKALCFCFVQKFVYDYPETLKNCWFVMLKIVIIKKILKFQDFKCRKLTSPSSSGGFLSGGGPLPPPPLPSEKSLKML